MNRPLKFKQNRADYYISTSIGIVFYPQDGADMKSLMKHADQAMYAAKHAGKGRYVMAESGGTLDLLMTPRLVGAG